MTLPLLLEPDDLNAHLQDANLLIVDLGKESVYQQAHVPGAILVNGKQLVSGELPAPGRLPSVERLTEAFSAMGLTPETHVVVYDDEGGGWAGRFIWTLDAIGHLHYSYLNGGIHAWLASGLSVEGTPNTPTRSSAVIDLQSAPVADIDYVLAHYRDADHVIWDARSPEEYAGTRILAQRGGHIPDARHYEWTQAMDRSNASPFRIYLSGRQVAGL